MMEQGREARQGKGRGTCIQTDSEVTWEAGGTASAGPLESGTLDVGSG